MVFAVKKSLFSWRVREFRLPALLKRTTTAKTRMTSTSTVPASKSRKTVRLPLVNYDETHAPCVPHRLPSDHIQFNSRDISKMGLGQESTWKDQSEELKKLQVTHQGKVKRVLWIRHGEGIHNAAEKKFGKDHWENVEAKKEIYFDPDLNAVGFDQAESLSKSLQPSLASGDLTVDLIIVSPLTRAIRTAELAFSAIWDHVPVVAVELARERHGKNICDKRRTVTELKKAFPHVDFNEHMFAEADEWHTERRETPEEVRERVKRLMRWIMDLPAETVAVVGHSDFMSHAVEVAGFSPHWPANCELVPMLLKLDDHDHAREKINIDRDPVGHHQNKHQKLDSEVSKKSD